jgi:hypothetical protein
MTNKHNAYATIPKDVQSSVARDKMGKRSKSEKAAARDLLVISTREGMSAHQFIVSIPRPNDKVHKKTELRKAKARAPTAEELDSELAKYMGNEFVSKKLDDELDAYFKTSEAENQ